MPLNLSTNDGEFTPYLKYNAKAGRFYVRPQGATQDVEVANPRLAVDMAHIKTGWIFYPEGGAPEKVWDASPDKAAPRPAGPKKFKRGFEALVFGGDNIPGVGKLGLREFGSTASCVIAAILKMHAAYEAGAAVNPGKVPFYACKSVIPIQGAYGTNYEPDFALTGWVDRAKIPEFDEYTAQAGDARETDPFPSDAPPPASEADYGRGGGRAADLDDEIPFAACKD